MTKKEGRLSPTAKRLLEGARKRAMNPEVALKYLTSVSPKKLNAYDKHRIGREILARFPRDPGGGDEAYLVKVAKAYDLSDRERPKSTDYETHWGNADYWFKDAEHDLKVIRGEVPRDNNASFSDVAYEFTQAGELYEQEEKYDKAMNAYRKALEFYKKTNDKSEIKSARGRIDSLIKKRTEKKGDLSSRLSSVIAIAGVLGGIFFLSNNITGNAIADLTTKTTSFLGAGLLVVGLVAGFFWVKSRK